MYELRDKYSGNEMAYVQELQLRRTLLDKFTECITKDIAWDFDDMSEEINQSLVCLSEKSKSKILLKYLIFATLLNMDEQEGYILLVDENSKVLTCSKFIDIVQSYIDKEMQREGWYQYKECEVKRYCITRDTLEHQTSFTIQVATR